MGNARTAYIMYYSVTQYCMSGDGTDSAYEDYYKIAHGRGKDFVESSKGYFVGKNEIVFEVDLSDYENEGYLLP